MIYTNNNFSNSFWPSSILTEPVPDYRTGVNTLHSKLMRSSSESESIIHYLRTRINTEKQCADLFKTNITPPVISPENANDALKGAFDIICQEHLEQAHYHRARAALMEQDVLAPVVKFHQTFKHRLTVHRMAIEEDLDEFEELANSTMMARSAYWSACQALKSAYPDFKPPSQNVSYETVSKRKSSDSSGSASIQEKKQVVRLGRYTQMSYQELADSLRAMEKQFKTSKLSTTATFSGEMCYHGKHILDWARQHCVSVPESLKQENRYHALSSAEAFEVCQSLINIRFIKSVPNQAIKFDLNQCYKVQRHELERHVEKTKIQPSSKPQAEYISNKSNVSKNGGSVTTMPFLDIDGHPEPTNSRLSGFLDRFNPLKKNVAEDPEWKLKMEMTEADELYKRKINLLDNTRKLLEENMFEYFDEMQELEIKRIQVVKQAFSMMAKNLSETLSIPKEIFQGIALAQETLNPEHNINCIVEQLKTGPFCPKPIIYENYYYGSGAYQLFSVPLEETSRVYNTCVPPLLEMGLELLSQGFDVKDSNKKEKFIEQVWATMIPLKNLNGISDQINHLTGYELKIRLESYKQNTIANLIQLYLLELPECLLTFDLYEPLKIIYNTSQNDTQSRLASVSKLLATLPSPNYHSLKALSAHFHKLFEGINNEMLLNRIASAFSYVLTRPHTYSSLNMYDQHPKKLCRDLITNHSILFTEDLYRIQKSSATRSAIIADSIFVIDDSDDDSEISFGTTASEDSSSSSSFRRSFLNMMGLSPESGHHQSPSIRPTSITLFDYAELQDLTPAHSGHTTPYKSQMGGKNETRKEDALDIKRLSNDLETILKAQDNTIETRWKQEMRNLYSRPSYNPRSSIRDCLDDVDLEF